MSRYIDAEALKEKFINTNANGINLAIDKYALKCIEETPSIDIVRCKECRYCKRKKGTFKGEPIIFYRCEENNRDVENDDFCSFGERREP